MLKGNEYEYTASCITWLPTKRIGVVWDVTQPTQTVCLHRFRTAAYKFCIGSEQYVMGATQHNERKFCYPSSSNERWVNHLIYQITLFKSDVFRRSPAPSSGSTFTFPTHQMVTNICPAIQWRNPVFTATYQMVTNICPSIHCRNAFFKATHQMFINICLIKIQSSQPHIKWFQTYVQPYIAEMQSSHSYTIFRTS